MIAATFTAQAQRQEITVQERGTEKTKTIKLNKRLIEDVKKYGRVLHLRGVFVYQDEKITMIKRRGNTTARGNHYVYYRENVYFDEI